MALSPQRAAHENERIGKSDLAPKDGRRPQYPRDEPGNIVVMVKKEHRPEQNGQEDQLTPEERRKADKHRMQDNDDKRQQLPLITVALCEE